MSHVDFCENFVMALVSIHWDVELQCLNIAIFSYSNSVKDRKGEIVFCLHVMTEQHDIKITNKNSVDSCKNS